MEEKTESALKYAIDSNKIEDLEVTQEEKQKITEMLKRNASDESFMYSIVKELEEQKQEESEANGKTRK